MGIEGLEIDSRQCQLHGSDFIPSSKPALFPFGILITDGTHTSESQSVSGPEDGHSGGLPPRCATSGPRMPAPPVVAVTSLEVLMGLRAPFLLSPPLTGVSCSPKDEGARGGPADMQPGRLRHCRLSLGPDLHPEALVQPSAGGCTHTSGLGGSANWTAEPSSPCGALTCR